MTSLQQIRDWGTTHHPRWLVVVRVGLGLFLFAKGITFMQNATLLDRLLYGSASFDDNQTHWLPILITWANLLTGTLLIIGLWTRVMALLQLPILVGAIIFINMQKGSIAPQSELGLAILTLLGMLFFLIEGGGPLSLDAYFEKNKGHGSRGDNLPG
jgi:putative oxidoreductase